MVWSDVAGRNVVSLGDSSDWKQQNWVFQKLVACDEATFSAASHAHRSDGRTALRMNFSF